MSNNLTHALFATLSAALVVALAAGASAGGELSLADSTLKRIYNLSQFPDTTRSPRTYTLRGSVEYAGLSGRFTTHYDRDIGYVNELDLGLFRLAQSVTASGGWETNPNGIISDIDKMNRGLLLLARAVESREFLSAPDTALRREYPGDTVFNGGAVHHFRFSPENEISGDVFIDSYENYVVGVQMQYDFVEVEVVFSDYREVDGFPFAFHSELTSNLPGLNTVAQVTSGEVNKSLSSELFTRPRTDTSTVSFPGEKDSLVVPLEYYQGHLYFRLRVNGSRPRLFLLDSGAGGLVIDAAQVEPMGLKPVGSQPGLGVAGSTDVSFALVEEFNVAGMVFNNQIASVMQFGKELRDALRSVCGIVGYDFLARFVVTVDYDRQQMIILRPTVDVTSQATDIRAIATLDFYANIPTVIASVNDIAGEFAIDIGSGYGPLLHDFFVREYFPGDLPKRKADRNDDGDQDKDFIGGVGGLLPTKPVTIESFKLAGLEFQNQPAWTILGGAGITASKVIAGNIGNGFLDKFRVTFDYPHRRLILRDGVHN